MTYYVAFETSSYQGTVGKIVMGLSVVDYNGQRIGMGQAMLRFISSFLSWTKRHQGLHDMIAGCLVIENSYIPKRKTALKPEQ